MTFFSRRTLAASMLLCVVFIVACSSEAQEASDSEKSAAPTEIAPTLVAPTSTAAPAPTEIGPTLVAPTSTAAAAPTTVPVTDRDVVDQMSGPVDLQLWYQLEIAGIASVDREIVFESSMTAGDRLSSVIDLWMAGPTDQEIADSGLRPFPAYRYGTCEHPFKVEAHQNAAVVTLCQRYAPGQSEVGILDMFERTVASLGLDHIAVLNADGDRCIGVLDPSDPLSCLLEGDLPPANSWVRCPFGRATSRALVTGVDEWVNARHAPTITAPEVETIRAGALVTVFPSTLSNDRSSRWWMTVMLSGKGRCASVPAEFLTGSFGAMADVMPGVSFDLPTTGEWVFRPRQSVFDRTTWGLEGSFATSVSLQILDGKRIDDHLEQIDLDSFDIWYPDDWYSEPPVEGADRTVETIGVSDGAGHTLLAEVGDFTISATTYVYTTDSAPNDELEAFRRSIAIDRRAFFGAIEPPGSSRTTIRGSDYAIVELVEPAQYTETSACGTHYEYFHIDEFGQRRRAGVLGSATVTELPDRYLLWQVQCEGGDQVEFAIARMQDDGLIEHVGRVSASAVGVRADHGTHYLDGATIVFEGQGIGDQETILRDTFILDDLLSQLNE